MELAQMFKPVLAQNGVDTTAFSDEYIARAVDLVKSRISFVRDLWTHANSFCGA